MTEVLQIYINCRYENGSDIRIYEVGDKINQSTKLNCKKSFRFPGSITKTRYVNSKSINILSKEIKEALKTKEYVMMEFVMMEFEKLTDRYGIVGINNTDEISLYINLDLNEDKELIDTFIKYLTHLWRIRMHQQIKKLQERLVNGAYIEDDLIKSLE